MSIRLRRGSDIIKGFKKNDLTGGRWVTLDEGQRVYMKNGVVVSGSDDKSSRKDGVQKTLMKKEDEIYNLDYERAVVVYSDGTSKEINGKARQVDVSSLNKSKCIGQTFTHNHPSWKLDPKERCSPLSKGDICVALNYGFKEIRAVGKNDGFSMKIDENIEISFSKYDVRKYKRGEIEDIEYLSRFISRIIDDHRHIGEEKYDNSINQGKSELESQRDAQILHHKVALSELGDKIKGIKFSSYER